MVDAAHLAAFRSVVSMQGSNAKSLFEQSIAEYVRRNPGASVADVRDYAIDLAESIGRTYGSAVGSYTAALYDTVAEDLGRDLAPAEMSDPVDMAELERTVRYQAGKLVGGDYAGFGAQVGQYLADRCLRTSWQTVIDNANRPRDRKAGMRFARVPTGTHTCGFCIMLASRGFVYGTRERAGDYGGPYNAFHRHCDCTVYPGDESTEVEGYDPDAMYDAYANARKTAGTGDWHAIVAELNTRDAGWAYHGKVPSYRVDGGASPNEQQRRTAELLCKSGIVTTFRKGDDSATPTIDGREWSFTDLDSLGGVERAVVSATQDGADFARLLGAAADAIASDEYPELRQMLLVGASGELRRLIRQASD